MLDQVVLLSSGGFVLWSKTFTSGRPDDLPIITLIREVLIPGRAPDSPTYTVGSSVVEWRWEEGRELLLVVVYPKSLQLPYISEVLEGVGRAFTRDYGHLLRSEAFPRPSAFSTFDQTFDRILRDVQSRTLDAGPRKPRRYGEVARGSASPSPSPSRIDGGASPAPRIPSGKKGKNAAEKEAKAKNPARKLRHWEKEKASTEGLDFSSPANDEDVDEDIRANASLLDASSMGKESHGRYAVADLGEGDEESEDEVTPTPSSGLLGMFSKLLEGKAVDQASLDPILRKMKEHLIHKNVAANIADHLCQSVGDALIGKRLGTFQNVQAEVNKQMEIALTRILTPRTSTDLLRDIEGARTEGRPYVCVFVGVNGVGKSTNLSKTCFWLLANRMRVLVAACDTFRSGAVEQLRVHVRNLRALREGAEIELYEKGYGKDAAGIARDAIAYAKKAGFDVVLVDTAGRMQDNEPLMRSLAKLVSTNRPDKVIFVGEALVGNEAVDQLTKFNQALRDFSGVADPQQIDGIILSKFDTIDDKVGAALSMTYTTGQPILFVGTGQTYTDLRSMKVSHIVQTLLKD